MTLVDDPTDLATSGGLRCEIAEDGVPCENEFVTFIRHQGRDVAVCQYHADLLAPFTQPPDERET